MLDRFLCPFSAAALVVCCAAAHAAPPAVFTDKPYEEARQQALAENRLLIVKGTAEWCGPCKMMDKQTWPDERVVAWVREHAVAYSLDVDKEPKLAQELRIQAMPTIVAVREGKDFDRVVGFQSPEALLAFFEAVARGESAEAAKVRSLRERAALEGEEMDLRARMELAKLLLDSGELNEATERYVWLWNNLMTYAPSLTAVRGIRMAAEIEALVAQHGGARRAFAEIRDETERRLEAEGETVHTLGDWIVLNRITGETERTLLWIDRVKNTESGRASLRSVGYLVEGMLKETGRLETYGHIVRAPAGRVRRELTRFERVLKLAEESPEHAEIGAAEEWDGNPFEEMVQIQRSRVKSEVASVYIGLLLARRDAEAFRVRELVIGSAADTPELREAIVGAAIDAGALHRDLLHFAEGIDPAMRRQLDEAFRTQGAS